MFTPYNLTFRPADDFFLQFLLLVTLWLTFFPAFATSTPTPVKETGTLTGVVVNSKTGEPVSFAYLYIKETGRMTTAHNDGSFTFKNIPAGTYTLLVQRIGYRTIAKTVNIIADKTKEIKITLELSVLSSGAIEVVGNRENAPSSLEHASKTVSGAELRQGLGTTLSQTLESLPGFASRSMGAAPARPVVRGLGGKRVLLLQDGMRSGDVSAQSADHAVTIGPLAAEKIEVARGPAALVYGANAIGGVINVVRNQIASSLPDHTHGTASLQGQSVNTEGAGAVELGIPIGDFVIQADGNFRKAGDTKTPAGTIQNSELTTKNGAVGLSYVRPWGHVGVSTNLYFSDYGIPPDPEGGHAEGVDIDMRKYQFDAASKYYLPNSVFQSVTAKLSYINYYHEEIEASGVTGTEFGLLTTNGSVKLHHRKWGSLANGTLGVWAETKDYAVNGADTPDANTYSFAAFWVEEADIQALHLEAGLRFDHHQAVPDIEDLDSDIGAIRQRNFSALSSSISAIYDFGAGYYLGATLLHSFRAPTLGELYSEGPHLASYSFEIGNPDLEAERGLAKELFLRYRGDRFNVELTGYHNTFFNYIFPRNTGEQSPQFPTLNIYQYKGAPALLYGFEASGEVQLIPHIALSGSLSYTHGQRELTDEERALNPDADEIQPLPMMPPLQGDVSVKYAYKRFKIGARTRFAAEQSRTGDFEEPTNGYMVFDLFGQYRFQTGGLLHTFSLDVENIFDQEYRHHLSRIKELLPEPGINVSLLYRLYF